MTALRLYLGDRLLGERHGRNFHLGTDFTATKNLLNSKEGCIKDNSISVLGSNSTFEKDRNYLIDLSDIKNITIDGCPVMMLESVLSKDIPFLHVYTDKVMPAKT